MLKIALAIHGLGRAEELAADEPELARVAREWAERRLTEARNSLEAGDRVCVSPLETVVDGMRVKIRANP